VFVKTVKPEGAVGNRESVAATLTSAVHMHLLTMQLQGKPVTLPDAIDSVRETWLLFMHDEQLNGVFNTRPTHLVTTVRNETATDPAFVQETSRETPAPADTGFVPPLNLPPIGLLLDERYRILEELGAGGMGKVFLAEQLGTGRKIAIKFMRAMTYAQKESALKFFRQEAVALARLNHPNIAQVYDAAPAGEGFYIAMEYVPGDSLRRRLSNATRLPPGVALEILREVCLGLATAHRIEIIHRDLKPENLMISYGDSDRCSVKILDFGIAIVDNKDADNVDSAVGNMAGTIAYMSPEQLEAQRLTAATDVYSLGIIAYEMLTGKNPFLGDSVARTAMNHLTMTPDPIRDSIGDVPKNLEAAIFKALEKDPQARFATAEDFLRAL
jgi:eukaryotic-like serine/threonine-protein kinase